jgi:hypothetical protein
MLLAKNKYQKYMIIALATRGCMLHSELHASTLGVMQSGAQWHANISELCMCRYK